MKHFDAQAVQQALPWAALIAALRQGFVQGCEVPARHPHTIGDAGTTLLMPAWLPGRCYGVKIVNIAPGNAARGLPGLHSCYLLFDASTGAPIAMLSSATRAAVPLLPVSDAR